MEDGCLLEEAIASNNSLDYGDVALSCFIEDKKNFLHVGGGHIPHLPSLPHVALQPCIHCSPPMVFPHTEFSGSAPDRLLPL